MALARIRRHRRLRPSTFVGRAEIGMRASIMSGCRTPHIQVCMPPIEMPITAGAVDAECSGPGAARGRRDRCNRTSGIGREGRRSACSSSRRRGCLGRSGSTCRIERLPRREQWTDKRFGQHLCRGTTRAVHDQYGIADLPRPSRTGVPMVAEVELHLRQRLAALERVVCQDEVTLSALGRHAGTGAWPLPRYSPAR